MIDPVKKGLMLVSLRAGVGVSRTSKNLGINEHTVAWYAKLMRREYRDPRSDEYVGAYEKYGSVGEAAHVCRARVREVRYALLGRGYVIPKYKNTVVTNEDKKQVTELYATHKHTMQRIGFELNFTIKAIAKFLKNREAYRCRTVVLTNAQKSSIIEAYVAGESVNNMRRKHGIGMVKIFSVVDAAGIPRRGVGYYKRASKAPQGFSPAGRQQQITRNKLKGLIRKNPLKFVVMPTGNKVRARDVMMSTYCIDELTQIVRDNYL